MSSFLSRLLPSSLQGPLSRMLHAPGFSNTLWLFSDRLLRMGLGLLVGVWIARYLGPTGYGLLSFVGSLAMLFSALAIFGLESIVVKELVQTPQQSGRLLGSSFLIRLLSGVIAYLLAIGAMLVLRPGDQLALLMLVVLGSSLVFQAAEVIDLWFQSRVESRYSVIVKISAFLTSSVVKVLCVLLDGGLLALAVATAVETALVPIGLLIAYRITGGRLSSWSVEQGMVRRLLNSAAPMVLSGIVLMVYLRIDQVMLGWLSTQDQVGQYAAAVRISEVWFFVPAAIVSSLFPRIIQLRSSDELQFRQKLQHLYGLLAFLGYAVALPTMLLAPWLVRLLFGAAYLPAGTLLAILIWSGLFANLTVARNAHLIALEAGRALLWCTMAGALANIVLNLFLIPPFGAIGAATSTVVSYWIAAHGACYLVPGLRGIAGMVTRALLVPKWW